MLCGLMARDGNKVGSELRTAIPKAGKQFFPHILM